MTTLLSLKPIDYTIQATRGYQLQFGLTFEDEQTGGPANLTGDTVSITVKDAAGATKVQRDAVLDADPTTGLATLTLTAADTTDAHAGVSLYRYVITRTHGGIPTPWFSGVFEIHPAF